MVELEPFNLGCDNKHKDAAIKHEVVQMRFGSRCQLRWRERERELLKSHIINLEVSLRAVYNVVIHYIYSAAQNLACDSAAFTGSEGVNRATEMKL